MDSQYLMISLYENVCQAYKEVLQPHCQRMSNNQTEPAFTDQELITIYLFGILKKSFQVKQIYHFIKEYGLPWFPSLLSYQAFDARLNRLSGAFLHLTPWFAERLEKSPLSKEIVEGIKLLDSVPIVIAKGRRADRAKVAPEVAAKGGHASLVAGFYGVKLHVIANKRNGKMPLPEVIQMAPGNMHDLPILQSLEPYLSYFELFVDKAYVDEELKNDLDAHDVTLQVPVKKVKNRKTNLFLFERLYSRSVSRVRQPIESFFNWLHEHTGIQIASKVRSTCGLFVHVFGRLSAAFFKLLNP